MKAIVAVDPDWGIGAEGGLLVHIPEDLKRFRRLTSGHPVVMGRSTFCSLPDAKPLPGRENLVLSRNEALQIEGVTVLHSLAEILAWTRGKTDEVFVIGGQEVYAALLPYCDTVYVTHVEGAGIPRPDKYFPNLLDAVLAKEMGWHWVLAEEEPPGQYQQLRYVYRTYRNEAIRPMHMV